MLWLGGGRSIPRAQLSVEYARAGGPGGQHVNKTETKVCLRLNLPSCESLSEADRSWLLQRLAPRITKDGDLIVCADRSRHRSRNLEEAEERLQSILQEGLRRPVKRRRTKPTAGSKRRRLDAKKRRGALKLSRGRVRED